MSTSLYESCLLLGQGMIDPSGRWEMAKLTKDLLISVLVAKPNSSEFIMLGNFVLLHTEQQDKLKDTLIPLNYLLLLELVPSMWHFEKPLKI